MPRTYEPKIAIGKFCRHGHFLASEADVYVARRRVRRKKTGEITSWRPYLVCKKCRIISVQRSVAKNPELYKAIGRRKNQFARIRLITKRFYEQLEKL